MEENFNTQIIGRQGEDLACSYLEERGYTVKERNWRSGRNEIDIIATKAGTLHFVEVKSRSTEDSIKPETKVNANKLKHLKMGAEAYLQLNSNWKFIQFDIISIILNQGRPPKIFLIEDVF